MLELKISTKNEYTIYPDISGNLSLPESDRFAIIVAKKHRMILQNESIGIDGKFDFAMYAKACVTEMINPPMLNFGKLKRAMTLDDIFTITELESVSTEIFNKVSEIQSSKGADLKN